MKITKIEDRMIASEAEQVSGVVCILPPCVFPCRPECTQSQLSQPDLPQACGPWGAGFASLGQ
jgi:hypothetical protein